jgi:hypothetical protein
MTCSHCHESARFVDYRPRTVQSLVGTFSLGRAYFHRRACGTGMVPWDETLDLLPQKLTPGDREVICVAGAVDSFGEATGVVLVWRQLDFPAVLPQLRMLPSGRHTKRGTLPPFCHSGSRLCQSTRIVMSSHLFGPRFPSPTEIPRTGPGMTLPPFDVARFHQGCRN